MIYMCCCVTRKSFATTIVLSGFWKQKEILWRRLRSTWELVCLGERALALVSTSSFHFLHPIPPPASCCCCCCCFSFEKLFLLFVFSKNNSTVCFRFQCSKLFFLFFCFGMRHAASLLFSPYFWIIRWNLHMFYVVMIKVASQKQQQKTEIPSVSDL